MYGLEGFEPRMVDEAYLRELGVSVEPAPETLEGLMRGSRLFAERYATHTVIPRARLSTEDIDIGSDLEIHNC